MAYNICLELLALEPQIKSIEKSLKDLKTQKADRLFKLEQIMQQQDVDELEYEGHKFQLKQSKKSKPLTVEEKVEQIQNKLLEQRNINIDNKLAASLLKYETDNIQVNKIKIK
jgi:hypothetical protein